MSQEELQAQINGLVSSIAANYREHPDTIPLDSRSLPNRRTIIEIIHLLREVLFPGYFGKQRLVAATIEYYIGDLIVGIREQLREQIVYALKHESARIQRTDSDINQRADEIIFKFLSKIPELRNILTTDVQAALDGDPAAEDKDEIIFSYPGIFAVSVNRLAHELYLLSVPLIPRIMTEYAHSITGIDIHAGAQIGSHFFIDHGTGVVIGETTIIGNRVKLYQGVTLGALSTKGGQVLRGVKRHPTIEDDVTVYSGASILGGETVIGQGVVIGSNVFITKSVPDRTKVSVKNPELLFKGHSPREFEQEFIPDWNI
ncbi:MAG TPA: serine O-acetyltransferase EpsC [Negativicutes bacterium]|nr:serine O-acetyltransferase EpsC [Negativicutes bacterium]